MKICLTLILICGYQCFSQCSKNISSEYGTIFYKCADGSVSFAQPKSEQMTVEWRSVYRELRSLIKSGELESFPNQRRKLPISEPQVQAPIEENKNKNKNKNKIESKVKRLAKSIDEKSIFEKVQEGYKSLKDEIDNLKKQIKISEGKCGATASSNVFHAYCEGLIANPNYLMKNYFKDTSPGILPETLKIGLNKLFLDYSECIQGKWKYYYSHNRLDFLDSLYKYTNLLQSSWSHPNSPLIVLIGDNSGNSLHYITIVNITGYTPYTANDDIQGDHCKVTYNDQSAGGKMQTTINCRELIKLSEAVTKHPLLKKVLKNYTRLVFLPY